MDKKNIIFTSISIVLILVIGLITGYSVGYFQAKRSQFNTIVEVPDTNPNIATIQFLKLNGSTLEGIVTGNSARIAYSPDGIFDVQPEEKFEIPIYNVSLSAYYGAKDIPEGTQFIASKQGKYYYHILDPKSLKITPKNRIYFSEENEAVEMGYLPKN